MAFPDDREDAYMELVGKEPIFCLPVSFVPNEGGHDIALSGLVLKTTGITDAGISESVARYRRVGFFLLYCAEGKDERDQVVIDEVLASEEVTFAVL